MRTSKLPNPMPPAPPRPKLIDVNNIPVGAIVQWTDGAGFEHKETVVLRCGEKAVKGCCSYLPLRTIANWKVFKPLIVDKERVKANFRQEMWREDWHFNLRQIEMLSPDKADKFVTQMVDRLLA